MHLRINSSQMTSPVSVQFRKSMAGVAHLYMPIRPRVQNMYLMCAETQNAGQISSWEDQSMFTQSMLVSAWNVLQDR